MTTAVIMQPAYLPWLGYFDLLDQADVFILDDLAPVNLKSWQTRNRIRGRDGNVVWLSIPVHAQRGQPLNRVRTANEHGWAVKQARTAEAAYSHAPYWKPIERLFTMSTTYQATFLTNYTEWVLTSLAAMLGIHDTWVTRASTLKLERTDRIGRLADMLHAVQATELLDTPGARTVLDTDEIEGTPIRWHNYQHPEYTQGEQPFLPYLSVIDLLAWHGPGSLDVIRSGRRSEALA